MAQFLHPASNGRQDNYGGSIENRSRFVLEVVKSVVEAIGKERVGIRLSPHGVNGGMPGGFDQVNESFTYLAEQLNALNIVYLHLVDHSGMGAPKVPAETIAAIRQAFKNTIILCGDYDRVRAEADLTSALADLIAFGRPFIANPDLVQRLEENAPLTPMDGTKLYTPGPDGYIDYPALAEAVA